MKNVAKIGKHCKTKGHGLGARKKQGLGLNRSSLLRTTEKGYHGSDMPLKHNHGMVLKEYHVMHDKE
jgi:hypothetical protein